MVVGDVVSAVFDNATVINFQPAASVSVCLTVVSAYTKGGTLTDGATSGLLFTGTYNKLSEVTTKLFLTNSIYLGGSSASPNGSAYSGIQIK